MARTNKGKRPKLEVVPEEMRRVFSLIAEEVATWPEVTAKSMFGLRAMYRGGVVFAMIPDKRSLEIPDAVAYKEGGEWKTFEVKGEEGIGGALGVLEKAYARSVTK